MSVFSTFHFDQNPSHPLEQTRILAWEEFECVYIQSNPAKMYSTPITLENFTLPGYNKQLQGSLIRYSAPRFYKLYFTKLFFRPTAPMVY